MNAPMGWQPQPGCPQPGYPQQGYPQQGYQPRAYPPQVPHPGWGRLVINTGYSSMAFLLAVIGPQVEVDGMVRSTVWGDCIVDVPPGQHYVAIHTRYLGQMGRAALTAVVQPGQQVLVFYRPPAAVGMAGSIGFEPQKTRGMVAMMVIS
ncbi:MAG: hypothetical protein ABI251_10700 [Mycobacteriaceae bacterium]